VTFLARRSPTFSSIATVYAADTTQQCYHQFVHTSDSDCSDFEDKHRSSG
jgi:hypothetical protein